jgi:hypothetical protein
MISSEILKRQNIRTLRAMLLAALAGAVFSAVAFLATGPDGLRLRGVFVFLLLWLLAGGWAVLLARRVASVRADKIRIEEWWMRGLRAAACGAMAVPLILTGTAVEALDGDHAMHVILELLAAWTLVILTVLQLVLVRTGRQLPRERRILEIRPRTPGGWEIEMEDGTVRQTDRLLISRIQER